MLLGALIDASGHHCALDLGAGTGVLSLMIAQKNPIIKIDAIEIHNEGTQECLENFINSPWCDRLSVFQGDYFSYQFQKKYDLVFSNPPFYLDGLPPEDEILNRTKHSNQIDVSKFFDQVNSALTSEGKFWIIFPYVNMKYYLNKASELGFFPVKIINIHAKIAKRNIRAIICFQREKIENLIPSEFTIRTFDNQYSSEYKNLTCDFHWNLFY